MTATLPSRAEGRAKHPTTRTWQLPPEREPLGHGLTRTNLRALAAREGRFEHHLVVVARIGDVQLEHATASEPLYFAHANVSDEYALPLSTGDARLDAARFRVFLSDRESGADVGRIAHGVGDLVLHPHGLSHWPGRLRPPFEVPASPPGARRAVHSLVFCACRPTPPVDRPLFVGAGREEDAKAYVDPPPPFLLAPLAETEPGVVARVGEATLRLATPPFAPERGGYVVVLEADGADAFACDLVHVPKGGRYEGRGVRRALVFESSMEVPGCPPPSWQALPEPPFAPLPMGERGALPVTVGAMELRAHDELAIDVHLHGASARVPRYWLARMLFRLGLHGFALGTVETYGGFVYDDAHGEHRIGLRGAGHVTIATDELVPTIERLYRAVAPPGYVEDLR